MSKFLVDFELAGHIEVEAKTENEAMEVVAEKTNIENLIENVQHFNVGRYYVEKK